MIDDVYAIDQFDFHRLDRLVEIFKFWTAVYNTYNQLYINRMNLLMKSSVPKWKVEDM